MVFDIPEDFHLIKPCDFYKREYKYCKSLSSRFEQLYIKGYLKDCSSWKEDFKNCSEWFKTGNIATAEKFLVHDRERLEERTQGMLKNDVWELRDTTPPVEWDRELPEYFAAKMERSNI